MQYSTTSLAIYILRAAIASMQPGAPRCSLYDVAQHDVALPQASRDVRNCTQMGLETAAMASGRREGRGRALLSPESSAAQDSCQNSRSSAAIQADTGSDDGITSRRSSSRDKPATLQSMSCWGVPSGSNGSSQSSGAGALLNHCTPRVVMRGFPTDVPSTGMPEKSPESQRQAVSAAAGWNAGANYGTATWPTLYNATC